MRETVQTKMARLERKISELELEQKELKKQNKLLQKGDRQNLCEIEKIHKVEVSALNAEIARLKRENEELKNTKEELVKDKVALISRAYNSGKTKEEIAQEKMSKKLAVISAKDAQNRLEAWNMGLTRDQFGVPFIDPSGLNLNINPHTGERLRLDGCGNICCLMLDNPYYQAKADEVYDFKDTHYNEREIEDFIDSVGRDLYEKLYPDFPFEKYVL